MASAYERRGRPVEVVVTGPDSPAASVRPTSEVVRQPTDEPAQRVTFLSYGAYGMASVINALDDAVAQGVLQVVG